MDAAEIAINYALLTGNGRAGDREGYKYCIDWLGEGEHGEKRRERGNSVMCWGGEALLWSI